MQFDYIRPQDWAEAVRLLAQPDTVGKMGGCDLLARHRRGKLKAKLVVGLDRIPEGDIVSLAGDRLRIGHAVTLAQLARNAEFRKHFTLVANQIGQIASPAVRSMASVVGNIAQGWSVGDVVPLLMIYDAELVIRGTSGERKMLVADYAARSGNQALQPGELIVRLEIPMLGANLRVAYERFCFRRTFDLPLVSVAAGFAAGGQNARIACVGGAGMPARCPAAEAAIEGNRLDDAAVQAALAAIIAWAKPVSDHLASADYRRHVLGVTASRALAQLVS